MQLHEMAEAAGLRLPDHFAQQLARLFIRQMARLAEHTANQAARPTAALLQLHIVIEFQGQHVNVAQMPHHVVIP